MATFYLNHESELYHYGVKGMKWGIRRYQNADGSLTPEGRARMATRARARRRIIENSKTDKDANDIWQSLSLKEKKLLSGRADDGEYSKPWVRKTEDNVTIAKRFVEKVGDVPVSFFEIYDQNEGKGAHGDIAIATRSGKEFRRKGYAQANVTKALDWYDKYGHKTIKELYWEAADSNPGSYGLALKNGFEKLDKADYPDHIVPYDGWGVYKYKGRRNQNGKRKHSSNR